MPGRDTRERMTAPFGLDLSLAVFHRATRFARGLFVDAESTIVLVKDGVAWRSRWGANDPYTRRDNIAEQVMASGQPLWVADASLDPRFANLALVAGPPHLRTYIATPIKLADGSVPGLLVVVSPTAQPYDADQAERLEALAEFVADEWVRANAAKALEATRTTLEALVATMPTSLVMTDKDLRVIAASSLWARSLGVRRAEVMGQSLFDIAPGVYEQSREAFAAALNGAPSSIARGQVTLPIGLSVWLQTDLKTWKSPDGEIGGIVLTASDVSELVGALEQSERSEQRMQLALELTDLHVWEMDYGSRELTKVGIEETFFERPQTYEDLWRDIYGGVDPRDRADVEAAWQRHMATGERYDPIYRVRRDDGREVWVQGAAKLFTREDGRPIRLVGALQNMTDRKAAEAELIQAKNNAEAANTAKSTFLATMSHEIRTPLNGVLGMAQAMASDDLSGVQRERLEVIRQSGESLLAVLNDVLDLSKIEAGKFELYEAEFDLRDLARGAHAAFTAIAHKQGLDFDLTIEPSAEGVYRGDPTRVRQILYNLISNALKFTEAGEIRVAVARRGEALRFQVSDTGIGIAAEPLGKLFGRFEQADASTSRRYGGTGLGLAICRQLTELMGGEIGVESQLGKGATFTFTLPLPRVADSRAEVLPVLPPTPADAEVTGEALKVLAAEDNAVNQLVLKTLMQQVGIAPVIVTDGAQAIAAWEAGDWDVILMDVQMPQVDGPTATRAIRARERATGRPRTPIIALTANAMSHQVAEYRAAGMDGFVAKPIEVGRLFAALEAVLNPAPLDEAVGG
ncbi:ATP-binding protein [Caulobacter sp. NIBR1757]|uniref:ATP-binding protein n=1 Tax=Caulobacter sp. NIBR1757 TaxID=3016000 RepID=UPI0022F13B9C|nr:ATP-binding protein [Caulobacter sp. NIBR1757]WGM37617.1 Sensor histidine kinase RcsC [Caulobacter sp. NIBR1757]